MKISKLELIFLSAILLIGGFLRLYRIKETTMFLGDQGRDAIIAKNILKNGDIALIGPVTSVGNMYLGPFYYYFMVPWLAISYPDPIGPSIGIALIGILTIPLVYFLTKKMFGVTHAVFISLLVTTSPIIIDQVRFSWNPNLAPTIGFLIFSLSYFLIKEKKVRNIIWLSILFSIISQLHYMALITGVFIVCIVIYQFYSQKKSRIQIMKNSLMGMGIFSLSTIPLIIFDIRHNHLIGQAFSSFFNSSEQHLLPLEKITQILLKISGNFYKLLPGMLGSKLQISHQIISMLLILASIYIFKNSKNNKLGVKVFALWFAVSASFMSLYSSSVFIHYISYSQIVSFMFIGFILGELFKISGKYTKSLIIMGTLFFMSQNLISSPAFAEGKENIKVAQKTSQSIYQRIKTGEKYNLVLISGTGDIDAQNYRYFLETTNKPPVSTENRGEVETLFIIQEDYFDTKAIDSPIYEIVVFPDKEPKEVYNIENGPTITVLKKNNI